VEENLLSLGGSCGTKPDQRSTCAPRDGEKPNTRQRTASTCAPRDGLPSHPRTARFDGLLSHPRTARGRDLTRRRDTVPTCAPRDGETKANSPHRTWKLINKSNKNQIKILSKGIKGKLLQEYKPHNQN